MRAWRMFAVFLAASAAAHAAVLLLLPLSAPDRAVRGTPEVLLVQIEPPRPLPVEPERVAQPQPEVPSQRVPERAAPAPTTESAPAPHTEQVLVAAASDAAQPLPVPETVEPAPGHSPAVPAEARPPLMAAAAAVASVAPPQHDAAYLRNPPPRYPLAARRAGEQGTVTLRVLVARDGLPVRVELERSSGSRHLDAAALEAVRAWRFVPARRGSDPVESWVLVPIVFRLEG